MLWIKPILSKEIREGFLEAEATKSESVIVQRAKAMDSLLFSLWAWSADCDVRVRGRPGPRHVVFICHAEGCELYHHRAMFIFFSFP